MTPKTSHKTMHTQEQNLHNMSQASLSSEFLKKMTQFVLPFSVFSFFFLHPSWLPFFFHSFISHFSTFHSQLLSYATDKNYIFLLCNGILVFIAKYSSRSVNIHSPFPSEMSLIPDADLIFKEYRQSLQSSIEKSASEEDVTKSEDKDDNTLKVNEAMPEKESEVNSALLQITEGGQRVDESLNDVDHDNDIDYAKENIVIASDIDEDKEQEEEDEDEEQEQEAVSDMSTEELNRKFDEFIRRMKQEIRFEAQRQLITV